MSKFFDTVGEVWKKNGEYTQVKGWDGKNFTRGELGKVVADALND